MDKQDWMKAKKKLLSAFEEGLTYLKEGAREAQHVADQATHVVKLEVDLLKLRNRLEALYKQLGQEMAGRLNRGGGAPSAPSREKARQIATLEKAIQATQHELKHTSITRRKPSPRASAGAAHKVRRRARR